MKFFGLTSFERLPQWYTSWAGMSKLRKFWRLHKRMPLDWSRVASSPIVEIGESLLLPLLNSYIYPPIYKSCRFMSSKNRPHNVYLFSSDTSESCEYVLEPAEKCEQQ